MYIINNGHKPSGKVAVREGGREPLKTGQIFVMRSCADRVRIEGHSWVSLSAVLLRLLHIENRLAGEP